MSRIFRPSESLIVEAEDVQHALRTDRPAIQYIRRSSSNQVKNSLQSKIQQDEATERKLRARGFTIIRKISLDDGKSGQKLIIEREGIQQLYHAIQHDDPGAIAFYDASRLWRDTTHVWYNDFIQMIQKYRTPVITMHVPIGLISETTWTTYARNSSKPRTSSAILPIR